jgi:N-acetylneuraminate synthase/N,N'-diacetyllegionaminate synthase
MGLELADPNFSILAAFDIGGIPVGHGRCFIIAEAGVNHNGDVDKAIALIDAAVAAGADAVKFQTFDAKQVISAMAPKATYQEAATTSGESQLEMIQALELKGDHFRMLKRHCDARGIVFLSTPFDHISVDLLQQLGVPAFKIPSGEITNMPLIKYVAAQGRPIILSTGMADLVEVEKAVDVLNNGGCAAMAILHCVSCYPTAPEDVNLRAMATLRDSFGVPIGLSDHSLGIEIPLAAVALGAAVIEKHFTLDKSLPGPDHAASLDPTELAAMAAGIRKVEAAMGDGVKAARPAEANTREVARRSLFLQTSVAGGANIGESQVIALRPAGGIPPYDIDKVLGSRAARDLEAGTMLSWDDLI